MSGTGKQTLVPGALAVLAGIGCFPFVTRAFWEGSTPILFYAGLCGAAATGLLQWSALRLGAAGVRARDAASCVAIVSLTFSFNVTFLVVGPVTIDRSLSTYMLRELESQGTLGITAPDLEVALIRGFIKEEKAIERRLDEQLLSGTVVRIGDRYFLSSRGRAVTELMRATASIFGVRRSSPGADREDAPL